MPQNLEPFQYMGIGIMTGTSHMIASIVRLIEEKGLLAPDEFAAALDKSVAEIRATPSPMPPTVQRFDAMMMERVAIILRQQKGKGWKPVVIQGGLSDQENTDSSD